MLLSCFAIFVSEQTSSLTLSRLLFVLSPNHFFYSVGFSDIEFFRDDRNRSPLGQYWVLSDNGFGAADNSEDYALNLVNMKIQKPFTYRHGESTFERYTETENLKTVLITDPHKLIVWENHADIQVAYKVPDETWNEYKEKRVLTGRDFDVEGLAVVNNTCALVGDEHMPAIFAINPTTGEVQSPIIRTPDIDANGNFLFNTTSYGGKKGGKYSEKFPVYLSTIADKVHCKIEDLESNTCFGNTTNPVIPKDTKFRIISTSMGFEGFTTINDGSIIGFLEKPIGREPGVRVYRILPQECNAKKPPKFDKFLGYYPFELNANSIADTAAIARSNRKIVVIERNGFPNGHMWPAPVQPANKLCVVDLYALDSRKRMYNKRCILDYHCVDDPWDVDGNGIFTYALTQITTEQLIIVDDYCLVAGTDTNFPSTNQFRLDESQVPDWQEVTDTRWMIVCFSEPVFDATYPVLPEL